MEINANDYSESILIEQPAIALFTELGWQSANCFHETYSPNSTLGRETPAEVVLVQRLRSALERLNPDLPSEAIAQAIEKLTSDRSAMSAAQANREVYHLLKNGVPVDFRDGNDNDAEQSAKVRVIDWNESANNDFFLASQFWVTGEIYKRRADLVGFVNGLPLILVELKATHRRLEHAYHGNLRDYKNAIPQLFWYNAFIILSNGSQSRLGSMTAEWEHFAEWKKINSEGEQGIVSLETMLRGTCQPLRLLDLVENFTLFSEARSGLVKLMAKNHQYLGVNQALAAARNIRENQGRLGVFWHTQGSGKSYSMVFFSQKILRTVPGNWTFLVITDRDDLDGQIYKNFANAGAVSEPENRVRARNGEHLKQLLQEDHRYVFTLIQKFRTPSPQPSPKGRGSTSHYRGGYHFSGLVERARELRQKQTPAEEIAWELLRDRRFRGLKFRRQHQIGNYITDFYCHECRLVIELDGGIHATPEQAAHDQKRDAYLRGLGNTVLRFPNSVVLNDPTSFLKQIDTSLPSPTGRGAGGEGWIYPMLSERDDIIVITDEAHRSQYDTFALNMRNALPNAAFIGFTGTPLMVGEEKTREVFGDYVSIYNFKQSIDDGATVPLYYENRIPELQLTNENLNTEMEELLEDAELDEAQEQKLEREFAREYHLITRDDRLEKIAEDLVAHFAGRGQRGKAMVVSIDKATAVKMYDKVQKYWQRYLKRLRTELKLAMGERERELQEMIAYMEASDMAVVVSQAQNEVEEMKKKGVDIAPHRKRMVDEDFETKFKDANDPLHVVFVCAMWMTGFDVPSCSTIYLDKPMRNHTLMQTIARANRVFGEKLNGLIVDYVGVFRNLQKALAIYGSAAGGGINEGDTPVKDKSVLVAQMKEAIAATTSFCAECGVDLSNLQAAPGFERVKLLDDAVESILVNDDSKKKYLALAGNVAKIYKAILPDPTANEFGPIKALIAVIAAKIRALNEEADISEVMAGVDKLLDRSVATESYRIRETPNRGINLSRIDFAALKASFAKGYKRIEAEKLKAAIHRKLQEMILLNKTRMNFLEKFQQMIDEYNFGSSNVEMFFTKLLAFAQELDAEQKRGIAAKLNREELAVFDLLTRPAIKLNQKEEQRVKKVAKELLQTLQREKLVIDWRKRQQSRAAVRLTIEEILEKLPPRRFPLELYQQKCDVVYQHVYDSYYGLGRSVYSLAA